MTREEIIEFIRNLFNKDKGNTLNKELKIHKEVDEFLQKMIDDEPWFESKRRAFSCVARGIFHKVVCPTCGQDIPVMKAIQGRTHCSSKCNGNDLETRKKATATTEGLPRCSLLNLFAETLQAFPAVQKRKTKP